MRTALSRSLAVGFAAATMGTFIIAGATAGATAATADEQPLRGTVDCLAAGGFAYDIKAEPGTHIRTRPAPDATGLGLAYPAHTLRAASEDAAYRLQLDNGWVRVEDTTTGVTGWASTEHVDWVCGVIRNYR